MFTRQIEKTIQEYIDGDDKRILFVWGPRRSGKTTLLQKFSQKLNLPIFNFDLLSEREKFIPDSFILERLTKNLPLILIDEIQNFPESTLSLKILFDRYKIKIIATGSSELRQKSSQFDTLAGRFKEIFCLPFSLEEIIKNEKIASYDEPLFLNKTINELQIFGTYPEIYTQNNFEKRVELLQNILDTYVLKDIITIYELKNIKLAKDILTKIALQLGSEVSLREIAGSLGANISTVSNYIEIFTKNYILLPVSSFKTNLRKAISKHQKLYFYDLGIRNILVKDFRELSLRPDKGGIFENFVFSELEKIRKNYNLKLSSFFYREYGGKEIDLVIETYLKKYYCWEMKLTKKTSTPVFPLPHKQTTITPENLYSSLKKLPEITSFSSQKE